MLAKIIMPDLTVSEKIYDVDMNDINKERIAVKHGDEFFRVSKDRILNVEGDVSVLFIDNDLKVRCHNCNHEQCINVGNDYSCDKCSSKWTLSWAGVVGSILQGKLITNKEKSDKKRESNMSDTEKQTNKIDYNYLMQHCEVWTKSITFDYPHIIAKANILLIEDKENPEKSRKFSFNSYDGTFGKKSKLDDINAFIECRDIDGKIKFWYVKADKARAKLKKDNYELMSNE